MVEVAALDVDEHLLMLVSKVCPIDDVVAIEQISVGGNNRTFKVHTRKNICILKKYFRHAGDSRNRLESEYAFLTYAGKVAARWTPGVKARNDEYGLALYEYIEGKPFFSSDLAAMDIFNAAQFFIELNKSEHKKFATGLPLASEACFSIKAHIDVVKNRVDRLCAFSPENQLDRSALEFILKLREVLKGVIATVLKEARESGIDAFSDLRPEQRCVSPSDFGFHNAIKDIKGYSKFIDFEYAGWDDPAKMVGDFFSQLAVPVPSKYFQEFTEKCMSPFSDAENSIKRAYLLAPLYRIKWCCIVLNVFLPVNLARRKFAVAELNEGEYKLNQLEKAQKLFNALGELQYGLH